MFSCQSRKSPRRPLLADFASWAIRGHLRTVFRQRVHGQGQPVTNSITRIIHRKRGTWVRCGWASVSTARWSCAPPPRPGRFPHLSHGPHRRGQLLQARCEQSSDTTRVHATGVSALCHTGRRHVMHGLRTSACHIVRISHMGHIVVGSFSKHAASDRAVLVQNVSNGQNRHFRPQEKLRPSFLSWEARKGSRRSPMVLRTANVGIWTIKYGLYRSGLRHVPTRVV